MWSNQTMLRKKVENEIFNIAALHGANICQIFVYVLHHWKIFGVFFTAIFNWSPKTYSHPSNNLLELQVILVDLLANRSWSTRTQISFKSETAERPNLKYLYLKQLNLKKWALKHWFFLFPIYLRTWAIVHWLQFWQLRTLIHDNLCYLTIKSDIGQHSQFLRCLEITLRFFPENS